MRIESIRNITDYIDELTELLRQSVEAGASIGFVPPLTSGDARAYWQSIDPAITARHTRLIAAFDNDQLIGSVQLSLVQKMNGSHRAEVEKLMVLPTYRGKGISKLLMSALEDVAREERRDLLVLDTRVGDVAAHLYKAIGYAEAGQIPNFAKNADGSLDATQFFYKHLTSEVA